MEQGSRQGGEKISQALALELQSLERQAQEASPGYETQFLNRAANLCQEAGHIDEALGYYGRAIDAYLESGRFSAAEVVCRKILKIAPETVRARRTLAWLAISKGHRSGTDEEVAGYVEAARLAGKDSLAAKQLRMMADAAVSAQLRELLAQQLLELGDASGADAVFGRVYAEANGLSSPPPADQAKLWAKMLRGAMMKADELETLSADAGNDADEGEEEADDLLPGLITGYD
jgi:tetratricopeptide (TPR) repeat protein